MKYFSYGMNTNSTQMAARCPSARSLGYATLPNHQFTFRYHADIDDVANRYVDGVLWEITDDDLKELDVLEGFPHYYTRKTVTVIHNGEQTLAMVYQMTGDNRNLSRLFPSQTYLDSVLEGYREHSVPTEQIYGCLSLISGERSKFAA